MPSTYPHQKITYFSPRQSALDRGTITRCEVATFERRLPRQAATTGLLMQLLLLQLQLLLLLMLPDSTHLYLDTKMLHVSRFSPNALADPHYYAKRVALFTQKWPWLMMMIGRQKKRSEAELHLPLATTITAI